MSLKTSELLKVKSIYLKFLKSQEVLSEPFRDKLAQLKNFYLPLSKRISSIYMKDKKTKIIGLSGGQGSGKSTIAKILKIILKKGFNLDTVTFSIDDFYKTLKERKKMAEKTTPLFLTRGVPGTHDTKLLKDCLIKFKKKNFSKILIPKFDKSIDNRLPKRQWQSINKKPDIVIFEGWCVGVKPQKKKDLSTPINKLEKVRDKKKIWRNRVNKELKNQYKNIFKLIDKIIFLKVPSFKLVYKWRLLQEKKLRLVSKGKKIMTNAQVQEFIMLYERLTKHMLKNLNSKVDTIIKLDQKHRLKSIKFN
tara:strand:- start:2462 stop:3379 length:918 start_codon:yes stop_codon:yes gene_type:complete